MGRRKMLINNTTIPQHQIEAIARCILPDILAFYESEKGQRAFAIWMEQQEIYEKILLKAMVPILSCTILGEHKIKHLSTFGMQFETKKI